MSDSDVCMMSDSEEQSFDEEGSDQDDAAFEGPPPVAKKKSYDVLDPVMCLASAQKQVETVVDLLCCEPAVAQILLRRYKWDQDKLIEGKLSSLCWPIQ